ncbi:MAG: hypothetical protein H0U76_14495 [Ktedonobacteraceae bacterium]|nr:hypothetical protein [Ktedonobacteraceae bacterium]
MPGKSQQGLLWPRLSLEQAVRSWFVLGQTAYPVECCSTAVFKAFIASVTPSDWSDSGCIGLLDQQTLDDLDRWFLLLSLATANIDLPLYESEASAKIALRAKSEGVACAVV